MAAAPQWPRPLGLDDQLDDPLVLVDRFKEYYISICHHTADNPTATAPASYVMDVMFQANKVMTLLAKQMSALAARQCVQTESVVDPAQGVREGHPVEHGSDSAETPAACEEIAREGAEDFADNVIGTINDHPWREDDSEGDRDYEDDGCSEMDSEDEHYEYGDFGDISEEFTRSEREQREAESHDGQDGRQQTTLVNAIGEVPKQETEKLPLSTILDTNWDDENSAEDQDYEDDGSSDHDSEEDYYEYGDFDEDEDEERDAVDGERQDGPEGTVHQAVEPSIEQAVPGNIHDTVWGAEDSEGDQDWRDDDSSDRDSEDDYYEYGDFEDDENELQDELQHANEGGQQSGFADEPETGTVATDGHEHCKCADTSCWRDVYDWIPGLVIQEIPVRESTMSWPQPNSPGALHLKIRWSGHHSPYQGWSSQGLTHHEIIEQIHAALADSGLPELKQIRIQSIKPYNLSGDLEVHLATFQNRECLAKSAAQWLPLLKQGHLARITDIYYPNLPVNAEWQMTESPPQPSETCMYLPGLKIRWRSNPPYKAWDSRGLVGSEIREQVYIALRRSGNSELPAIHIPYMEIRSGSGDIDLFFNSYTDRDMLYDDERLWIPFLDQGHLARIVLVHDPKEEPEPKIANAEPCKETAPWPTIETPDEAQSFTIHWNYEPPFREWQVQGLTYIDIKAKLSYALDRIVDPPLQQGFTWSLNLESGPGDISVHFRSGADCKRAIDSIPMWFPHLERSEVARIPGVYNPLRRAKSNAKFSRQSRSPQAESQNKGMDESILTVQDGVSGVEQSGTLEVSPASQTRSERQLERRRTKRRQKRWENKIKKNAEVMAC